MAFPFNLIRLISTPGARAPEYPNIKLTMLPLGVDSDTHKIINNLYDLKHGYIEKLIRDHKDNDAIWIAVTLARPMSRGTIRLKNDDPHTHPFIDPNFFNKTEDVIAVVEGKKFLKLQ